MLFSAVGQIVLSGQDELRVVGVVGNVRHSAFEQEAGMEMYLPITQCRDTPAMDLVVRASLPVEAVARSVRAALRKVDPTVALRYE